MAENPYGEVLREWIGLYAAQEPRQAELLVPAWAVARLNALPEEQRKSILSEIDQIAAGHGLLTPTKLIVVP